MDFEEKIEKKLVNKENLDYAELLYVFDKTDLRISPNYNRICLSVRYLLSNLQDGQREKLVKMLNRDFRFKPRYKYSIISQEESFEGFESRCVNKNTEKFAVSLAKQVRANQRKKTLINNPNEIAKI